MTAKTTAAAADRAKTDRRRAPQKKEKILDSAEAVFVRCGFHGTSLRDIAQAAGVPLALLSYHFGSKEGLFRAVIERRAPANAQALKHALQTALEVRKGRSRLESILRAFLAPVVERSMRGGPGWKNYVRLMAQVANLPQQETFLSAMPQHYEPVVQAFIAALGAVYPHMSDANLQWSFYFYQAAITHILVESGVIDQQTGGKYRSSDLDEIVPKLVKFCAAGFQAMAKDTH
jgi:AcrR family transcriptional regulator